MIASGGLVADRAAVAHPNWIGGVEPHDAMVLDIDAGHAIASGGNQEAIIKTELKRPRLDVAIPIEIAGSEPQVPLADDARGIAGGFERTGERRRAGGNNERGI